MTIHAKTIRAGSAIGRGAGDGDTVPAAGGTEILAGRLAALRSEIARVLGPLVADAGPFALLDVPNYANAGDSAILLGQLAFLAERHGRRPAHMCDPVTYDPAVIRRRCGGRLLFLHGGGNFGDIWPLHQDFRERVLRDFPDFKIVQLPQSIHFGDDGALARARRAIDRHRDFTLLVRDRRSLDFAERHFACPTLLCPDLAFAMDARPPERRPDLDVLCLMRTDKESAVADDVGARLRAMGLRVAAADWKDERRGPLHVVQDRFLATLGRRPRLRAWDATATLDHGIRLRLARSRVRTGSDILARGRAVVTDRLHGHVLCVLSGIPHVVLDNRFGKVRALHDAWTTDLPGVAFADTPDAVPDLLRRVAAIGP